MKAICVEDEALILQLIVSMCRELPQLDDVQGFPGAGEALKWLDSHPADLALLDIDLPDMNGIALAREIKERQPGAAVIFLTGYAQYALEAFDVHASGYLLKPVSREKLEREVSYALEAKHDFSARRSPITVQTFGHFELYVNGEAVAFERSKAKELLAYLVDRHGGSVTRSEAFAILWEDLPYDRPMQKQLDVVIRSLRKTLAAHGAGHMLELRSGSLRVNPECFDCDMYRFMAGDAEAINAYRGEYMSAYSWASLTEGGMTRRSQT